MFFRLLIFFTLLTSCSSREENKIPSYITTREVNDSIYVDVKNTIISSSFLRIENKKNQEIKIIDFKKPDTINILSFHKSEMDTTQLANTYKFGLYYGASSIATYDSLYNYSLPFSKGKRYKVLQGNNGSFSHKGSLSQFAIDFKMDIGQEVCAIREGVITTTKADSDEGGSSKNYLKKANLIMINHNDGTFSQYIHLKKNGVIVKKGDTVKKGQIIGYSGNTGFSTKPHLHFAVYKPTRNGLVSIPFILDSIPSKKYVKGKYAINN